MEPCTAPVVVKLAPDTLPVAVTIPPVLIPAEPMFAHSATSAAFALTSVFIVPDCPNLIFLFTCEEILVSESWLVKNASLAPPLVTELA